MTKVHDLGQRQVRIGRVLSGPDSGANDVPIPIPDKLLELVMAGHRFVVHQAQVFEAILDLRLPHQFLGDRSLQFWVDAHQPLLFVVPLFFLFVAVLLSFACLQNLVLFRVLGKRNLQIRSLTQGLLF